MKKLLAKQAVKDDFFNLFMRNVARLDLAALAEKHRSQSHITFNQYKFLKRVEIDNAIGPLKKIYLDLNFWIRLRDAIYDPKRAKPHFKRIFEILKEKVINKQIVCPFSSVLYEELLKQTYLISRRRTAQIADILTGNFSVNPLYYIIGCEVFNLIAETERQTFRQSYYTWSNALSVLGDFNLKTKADLSPEELVFKKLNYDAFLAQSFQEITPYNDSFVEDAESGKWHANMINQSKANSIQEKISFPALHRRELKSTYQSAAKNMKLEAIDFESVINSNSLEYLRSLTPVAFTYTSIYANFQLDKQRVIQPNDYYDLSHASLALGTCDYFFTERSFCSLLKSMKLHEKYGKVVEYDPVKILEILKSI